MAQTSVSNLTSYVSNTEFLTRYDANLVGMLVSDDNTQVIASDLATNNVLTTILQDASGVVESAILRGGRYSIQDLAALTGVSLQLLKRIVSGLAIGFLRQRRGMVEEAEGGPHKEAMALLSELSKGSAIFSFAQTVAAGLPKQQFMQLSDFLNLGLASNNSRWAGIRANKYRGSPAAGWTGGGNSNFW